MSIKTFQDKRIVVLLALVGAAVAANGKGNALAYLGIAYYVICAIAVLCNYHRTKILLWAAVAVHSALVVYSIWNWIISANVPCHYCMTAAGFALLAAVAWWKKPLAVLPAMLMVVIWYWWPMIFYQTPRPVYNETGNKVMVQPANKAKTAEPDSDCGCD